ncbi:MAG: adenosylmethionine--8-amino-7-oxononanoate transaminase [Candidatus Margulisbacteria bacterium]|jgi:adenosylmethionine-8-amino-7-oxononanoate transaminase|nr:adenosylmethionine--8-amino-7-oxononanoate transaminase [Candidatus Margulisiibacteriota bacterium]
MPDWQKLDKKYLWHPFTQMADWANHAQLVITRGAGSYLYDDRGRKYLDGVSSLWVTVHGHGNRTLNGAIKKQLGKVAHSTFLGLSHPPAVELARELINIAPRGLTRVFYSDDGSTAVEIALKIAFQYQQQTGNKTRTKFITLKNAYHGDTVGSVSVGGIDLFHKMYRPLLFKSFKVPAGDLLALERTLKKQHRQVAALIVEPLIQAAAGMLLQPPGYLKAVRRLCTKYKVLLIIDEVATGFGRTGKMFACEHEGVRPDLMCVAKGLTGGYLPVAATLTTEKVYRAFLGRPAENKTFFHGHTYTANPLGCAAAIASLRLFKTNKLLVRINRSIAQLKTELPRFFHLPAVSEIRQLGMMVGIELTGFDPAVRIGHRVILEARKRGAILRPLGDVIILMPPLNITRAELAKLLSITYDSIRAAIQERSRT